MEILSVTLKNFKSHRDRHFRFQPGTNAICGENGAGKTSILEAIAWVLFNYRGVYRIEDLIHNGANSAQVGVAFISNRDGRTYEVQRCTTKGYTIYDPQLDQRLDYKHIEAEIMPWIRQHLGVAPGTDLGKLFANTIGVPQGTFTADFLQTPENRKKVFDTILKVEEYKQLYTELGSLEKYAKVEVETVERAIAQYQETLLEQQPLQERRQVLDLDIQQDEASLQILETNLAHLQTEKERLTAQALQVQQMESRLQHLKAQAEGKRQANQVLEQALHRAQQAAQLCQAHEPGYQAFLQAEAILNTLDQQNKQYQKGLKQRDVRQRALTERQTEGTKLRLQLEQVNKAEVEITHLQPLIQQQIELEQQQEAIAQQLQHLQTCQLESQTLIKHVTKLRTDLTKLTKEITRVRSLASATIQIADLEQRRDRLQEQLSRVDAAKQFEADLRRLVTAASNRRDRHQGQVEEIVVQIKHIASVATTPLIDSMLTTIQAGVALNEELLNAVHNILADLAEQTSAAKLKQQVYDLKLQLETAYRQQAEFATLDAKQEQQTRLQEDIEQIQEQLNQLQTQLATVPNWQAQRSHITDQLTQLGDPRGRCQLLGREVQQQARLQTAYADLQQKQAAIEQEIAQLDSHLAQFTNLDTQMDYHKQQRQHHQPSYLTVVSYQKEAESYPTLEAERNTVLTQLQQLVTEESQLQNDYTQLCQDYDPLQYQQVEAQYHDLRSQVDRISGSLPQQRKLRDELDSRLEVLQAIAEKCDRAQQDLKQRERVKRFISFARKVYKEAGPRITERYVQSISREADRLFRELLNRPNVALEWTKEYEISIQEGAHTRRFINLSGGEQMCAALAVRLALLRVLADIDVAFFDEPTTNMDRPRRESLAEAIANIKTFRQLFVISHDDTFEKITENVIVVERDQPGRLPEYDDRSR